MNPILKNILAVIAGIVVGSIVNSALVNIGPSVFPLPEGADVTSMEGLKESIAIMKPQNFIFPFLGHAIGTLIGAFLAARIAATHKMTFAIVIGIVFLLGGLAMAFMVGGPVWFIALDLIGAYLPMALLGGRLAGGAMGREATDVTN